MFSISPKTKVIVWGSAGKLDLNQINEQHHMLLELLVSILVDFSSAVKLNLLILKFHESLIKNIALFLRI